MATRFVPFAVQMRRAGFVPTHSRSWSIYDPKWVQAPVVDMAAVDRTIDVLQRFVNRWVSQSRKARREYLRLQTIEHSKFQPDLWYDLGIIDDRRQALRERALRASYPAMPLHEWRAAAAELIAEQKAAGKDVLPLLQNLIAPIWAERDRRAADQARAVVEVAQVWNEMGCPQLHNRQRPAQVRVVRQRNRYDTGSDSE
jgi:hypothetical protein